MSRSAFGKTGIEEAESWESRMDCDQARAVSAGSLGGDTDAMLRSLNAIIEVTRGPEGFSSGRGTWQIDHGLR